MTQTLVHETFSTTPSKHETQAPASPYTVELGHFGITMAEEASRLKAYGVTAVTRTANPPHEAFKPIIAFEKHPDLANGID